MRNLYLTVFLWVLFFLGLEAQAVPGINKVPVIPGTPATPAQVFIQSCLPTLAPETLFQSPGGNSVSTWIVLPHAHTRSGRAPPSYTLSMLTPHTSESDGYVSRCYKTGERGRSPYDLVARDGSAVLAINLNQEGRVELLMAAEELSAMANENRIIEAANRYETCRESLAALGNRILGTADCGGTPGRACAQAMRDAYRRYGVPTGSARERALHRIIISRPCR